LPVVLEAFGYTRPAERVVEEAAAEGEGGGFLDWQKAGYEQYDFMRKYFERRYG
jgi:hypothetical protein